MFSVLFCSRETILPPLLHVLGSLFCPGERFSNLAPTMFSALPLSQRNTSQPTLPPPPPPRYHHFVIFPNSHFGTRRSDIINGFGITSISIFCCTFCGPFSSTSTQQSLRVFPLLCVKSHDKSLIFFTGSTAHARLRPESDGSLSPAPVRSGTGCACRHK